MNVDGCYAIDRADVWVGVAWWSDCKSEQVLGI